MWKTIDYIRRKPKATHNRYAFLGATIITGLIASVWLVSMLTKFDNGSVSVTKDNNTDSFNHGLKDRFGDVGDLISEAYQSFDSADSNSTTSSSDNGDSDLAKEVVIVGSSTSLEEVVGNADQSVLIQVNSQQGTDSEGVTTTEAVMTRTDFLPGSDLLITDAPVSETALPDSIENGQPVIIISNTNSTTTE